MVLGMFLRRKSSCPACRKPWAQSPAAHRLSMVVHTGGGRGKFHIVLCYKASLRPALRNLRPCLRTYNNHKNKVKRRKEHVSFPNLIPKKNPWLSSVVIILWCCLQPALNEKISIQRTFTVFKVAITHSLKKVFLVGWLDAVRITMSLRFARGSARPCLKKPKKKKISFTLCIWNVKGIHFPL